jgi:hypothetical protein
MKEGTKILPPHLNPLPPGERKHEELIFEREKGDFTGH